MRMCRRIIDGLDSLRLFLSQDTACIVDRFGGGTKVGSLKNGSGSGSGSLHTSLRNRNKSWILGSHNNSKITSALQSIAVTKRHSPVFRHTRQSYRSFFSVVAERCFTKFPLTATIYPAFSSSIGICRLEQPSVKTRGTSYPFHRFDARFRTGFPDKLKQTIRRTRSRVNSTERNKSMRGSTRASPLVWILTDTHLLSGLLREVLTIDTRIVRK